MPATCDESQDQHTSQEYGDKCESRRNMPKKRVRKSVPRANARRGRLDVLTKRRGLFFTNAFRLTIWLERSAMRRRLSDGRSPQRVLEPVCKCSKIAVRSRRVRRLSYFFSQHIFCSVPQNVEARICRGLASRHTEVGIFWCDPVASTLLNSLLKW